jgi:hypothetical protein
MTNLDECNIIDVLVGWIIVLVDDESSCVVAVTIALKIDVASIHRPQSVVLAAQIFLIRVDTA